MGLDHHVSPLLDPMQPLPNPLVAAWDTACCVADVFQNFILHYIHGCLLLPLVPPLCRSIMPSALSFSSWWKISGKPLDPQWMCFQNRAYRRILSITILILEKTSPSIYKRSGKSGERSETGGQRTHKGSFILPTWPLTNILDWCSVCLALT